MINPSERLLWIVGLLFVPACALPAFLPHAERYIAAIGALILLICLLDATISRHRLNGLTVVLPQTVRAVLNQEAKFAIELHRTPSAGHSSREIRLAVALLPDIEPIRDDIVVSLPESQHGVKTELCVLGRERGKFPIRQAFVGGASKLGLWQLRRTVSVDSVILIEPALSQISKETAKLLSAHRHGGNRIIARNGRGREFEQLREHVPSDAFGDIDWKATARRRIPIVRDYQVERTQDIYACVDFSRLSGRAVLRKDQTRATILDEYIRSALMLYSAVRQTGDRFGFGTFSNRVEYFVKATRRAGLDRAFRHALYPLRPRMVAPAFDEICSLLRTRVKRRALIVFFTSLAEPQLADAFLEASRLLVGQHLVVVTCPTDVHVEPLFATPELDNIDGLYGKLAGHLFWKKLAEVRLQLATVGIRMHAVPPGRLGLLAATEYLNVKETQLL